MMPVWFTDLLEEIQVLIWMWTGGVWVRMRILEGILLAIPIVFIAVALLVGGRRKSGPLGQNESQ